MSKIDQLEMFMKKPELVKLLTLPPPSNSTQFNSVYSRDNLSNVKNEMYVINLDEYDDIGTHWVAIYG